MLLATFFLENHSGTLFSLLTCFPHTAVALLAALTVGFGSEANVPQAKLAFIALQSLD